MKPWNKTQKRFENEAMEEETPFFTLFSKRHPCVIFHVLSKKNQTTWLEIVILIFTEATKIERTRIHNSTV